MLQRTSLPRLPSLVSAFALAPALGLTLAVAALSPAGLAAQQAAQQSEPAATEPASPEDAALAAALQSFQQKLQTGDLEGAIVDLEALVERPDAPPTVRGILGGLYVETGRMQQGYDLLRPLAESGNANPAVLYNLGRAARALGQLDLAVATFEQAAQGAPVSPAARELGLIRGMQGRYAEALSLLYPWTRANPDDLEARLAAAAGALQLERAADTEGLLSDLPQDDPRVRLLWGRLLLLREDPWGAIGYLKPLVEEAPGELGREARRTLASAYVTVGESSEAVALLDGKVGNDPSLALQLAQAQFQGGDLQSAIDTLEPFASEILRNVEGRDQVAPALIAGISYEYGRLLLGAGRTDEAVPFLRLATETAPEDKIAWQGLGQALAASGERDQAEQALARFAELEKHEEELSTRQRERDLDDPTGRQLREAMSLLNQGRGEEALRLVRSEGELAPQDPRPVILEARVLLLLGRAAEAEAPARRALEMSSESPDAHYVLGTVLMASERLEEAQRELEAALQIAPEHTPAMNDLAVLLIEQGKGDEAKVLLQRVLELRPNDPVAKDNLERLSAKG